MAVKRHPELAIVTAAAMVRFGGQVLEDLVCRCQGMSELRFRLERAANEEVVGDIIDAEVVANGNGRKTYSTADLDGQINPA